MPTDPSGALYKSLAYEHHLREARGQATATIANYVPFIRTFLKDRFGDEKGILWASNPSKRSLLHSRKPFLIRFLVSSSLITVLRPLAFAPVLDVGKGRETTS